MRQCARRVRTRGADVGDALLNSFAMTLNDIRRGKKAARVFYAELRGTTITEAAKEPLKLREVASMPDRPVLPTSEPVDYATALCFIC